MGFFTTIFPLVPEKSRMKFLIIIDKLLALNLKVQMKDKNKQIQQLNQLLILCCKVPTKIRKKMEKIMF